ncbi:hypothetical protein V8D89_016238 [Ganoderma adspersum]
MSTAHGVCQKVFQEIVHQLISRAPHQGASSFLSLSCSCRWFYLWAREYDHLWELAHHGQFGSLEDSIDKLFQRQNMTWRSLVLARLRILQCPILSVASWLAGKYEANLGVNYSEPQLLLDGASDHIALCTPLVLGQAFSTLLSFFTMQIQDRSGDEEAYFDSQIHKFKLSTHGRGPQTRRRYFGVERRGALPAPFPRKGAPTSVFTITISALDRKSPHSRALPYFHGMLSSIHDGLVRLVSATFDSTVAHFPQDPTIPKNKPRIKHVLLPKFEMPLGPTLDISIPLSSVKWSELFPENSLLGGDDLVTAIMSGNHRCRTSLLFFHPGGDPRLTPLAWLPLLEQLHEYSTIAYAFPADEAYREGYDRTTFGAHHLDYMISLTLKSLRKYDQWRKSVGEGIYESVGVERMMSDAGLGQNDAHRLHEVLERMALARGKGAGVYSGRARVVGASLPNKYC